MNEWGYAQRDPAEQLARLHFFSMTKLQAGGNIDFLITVKEYVTPKDRKLTNRPTSAWPLTRRPAGARPCWPPWKSASAK